MNQHNFFIKLLDTGLPATLHRQPRPPFCDSLHISADLLPVIYPATADSKTSPMNPVTCIVLHLENIASLGWILNCKFRPLNYQLLTVQSQSQN